MAFCPGKGFILLVKNRIADLLNKNAIVTTGIIKFELPGRAGTDKEFHRLKTRLDYLNTSETDAFLWAGAYDLASALRRKRITIPCTDIMIAAGALMTDNTVFCNSKPNKFN